MEETNDPDCIVKAFQTQNISIVKDDKNKYYFRGSDVAKALGITNISSSIQNYTDKEKVLRKVNTLGGPQDIIFLSSHGVYRLLYSSRKKVAEEFREWVGDVLDDIIFNNSNEILKQLEIQKQIMLEHQDQLEQKDSDHVQNLKLNKHKLLLEKFSNKTCVYLAEVTEKLIKIGSSKGSDLRMYNLKQVFGINTFLDIFECNKADFRDIEQCILTRVKEHLYKKPINDHVSKEVVLLDENTFNYEQLVAIVKDTIATFKSDDASKEIENESKKLDLIKQMLDLNYSLDDIYKLINPGQKENKTVVVEQPVQIREINANNTIIKRGRKIQVIDPDNLNVIVKVYDSMVFALRDPGHEYDKHCIQNAVKNNTIYKGFRWLFVEHAEDVTAIKDIKPTFNPTKRQPDLAIIVQLSQDKTRIIESYSGITKIKNKYKISLARLHKIIDENKSFDNSYFVKITECPEELLSKYKENNEVAKRSSTKASPLKQINILTNEEIIYKSISCATIKFGSNEKTITDSIKNNTTVNGFKFEYV